MTCGSLCAPLSAQLSSAEAFFLICSAYITPKQSLFFAQILEVACMRDTELNSLTVLRRVFQTSPTRAKDGPLSPPGGKSLQP